MAVRIVTDSSADLPRDVAEQLGITVVPAVVRFGEEAFLDGVEIDHDTFYRRLQQGGAFPTTSQPAPGRFAEAYARLGRDADGILSIHVSGRLSGTLNSAAQGARASGAACPIEVLDGRSTSLGLGLVVADAARRARAGEPLPALAEAARERIACSRFCAVLETLDYLAKGGRIGRAAHLLGTLVRIRPVIVIEEGEVRPARPLRTRAQAQACLERFAEQHRPLQALGVVCSTDLEQAGALAERLAPLVAPARVLVSRVGPALGSHAGPGMLAVALLRVAP